MNSFTLTAIGHLARDPEMFSKDDTLYARFCLMGNDYAGKDKEGQVRRCKTDLNFVAFGGKAEAIALHARKGDQLIVVAEVRAKAKTENKPTEYSFIVRDFRFGAPGKIKREEFAARDRSAESPAAGHSDEVIHGDADSETPELETADAPF